MATRLSFRGEWLFYVAVGAGMALSNSAFAMVSGLFAVTGTGPALVALLVAGVICTVIGAAIGELASMWPSSPAVITYFRAAFGPVAALVLVQWAKPLASNQVHLDLALSGWRRKNPPPALATAEM